jgi:hypothetical protein
MYVGFATAVLVGAAGGACELATLARPAIAIAQQATVLLK